MQLRLTSEEERQLAPFALPMAAAIVGLVLYDLLFWARAADHRPTLAHTAGYGVVLLLMWLWLAWTVRNPWLRTAWIVLALNELLSMLAAISPTLSPWWRRDVLLLAWAGAIGVWAWRRSPIWLRVISLLVLAGGLAVGQSMLSVERRPPIVRTVPLSKTKPK